MKSDYASGTTVPVEKSVVEIKQTLRRFGCDEFHHAEITNPPAAAFAFTRDGQPYRFLLPLPSPTDREITHSHNGTRKLTPAQAEARWNQATREQWRALALDIKARIVSVNAGITDFKTAFFAQMLVTPRQTAAEVFLPEMDRARAEDRLPSIDLFGLSDQKALPEGRATQ